MDTYLFFLINRGFQNNVFDIVMPFITDKGYILFVAAISPLFFKDWRKGLLIFTFCAAGYIIADSSGNILKHIFARPRPCRELQDARLLVACYGNYSFPSGHATTSFAMASIISHFFRRAALPAFFIAFLIGFSRIYIGVHYPLDVIAGAVWGAMSGGFVIFIYNINSEQFKKTL